MTRRDRVRAPGSAGSARVARCAGHRRPGRSAAGSRPPRSSAACAGPGPWPPPGSSDAFRVSPAPEEVLDTRSDQRHRRKCPTVQEKEDVEMTLESKRVVLLGGTAGIGLATAQAAAAAGARVVAVSSNPDNVAK